MRASVLRPYQVTAAHQVQAWIAGGERELLLESPVGSGKTTTVKALAASLLASGACRLVVVLVPQNLLKAQWAMAGAWKIARTAFALPEAVTCEHVADLTPAFWRTARGLVIVSRQALTSKAGAAVLAKLKRCLGDVLVVADEGHHCNDANLSGKTLAVLRTKGATTLLVSATPFATKGNVGGSNCKAHRFPEYEYVMAFGANDPARPPGEFVIDRVFVGTPVSDAKATIDRSGSSGGKGGPDDDRSTEFIKAMAKRWKADGFPCAVFNIPRQTWAKPLAEALRKVKPRANLLNIVGDDMDDDAKERLSDDSKAMRWADVKISAVLSCARMDEGIDWVPCSHVYNVGIPASPTLILQRWGRAARAKRKIEGYPEKWAEARTLVFFTPPGTGEGDSWKAQTETAWLLGGFIADYNAAREFWQERAARGVVGPLPVPELTPEVREWIGKLAEQIARVGGEMKASDARLWLVRRAVSTEVVDAVIKRTQMLRKEARDAVTTLGLQIKPERRAEAERLIEDTLLQAAPALGHAVTFTALGVKEIGERMANTPRDAEENARLIRAFFDLRGRGPSMKSKDPEEKRLGIARKNLRRDHLAVYIRHGIPLRDDINDLRALEIVAWHNTHNEQWPRICSEDPEEKRLGTALCSLRQRHPEVCARHGIPVKADRSVLMRRVCAREQFTLLGVLVPRLCRNFRATQYTLDIEGDSGAALNNALVSVDKRPGSSRSLGYAPDRCQVNSLARANDEIAADCWALTLDGATAPDPRPWADLLASGDHKRIVKAERVAFLDWEKPGKDGKPARRPWKAPKSAKG